VREEAVVKAAELEIELEIELERAERTPRESYLEEAGGSRGQTDADGEAEVEEACVCA